MKKIINALIVLLIIYFFSSINIWVGALTLILILFVGFYKNIYFQVLNIIFQNFFIGLFSFNITDQFHFKFLHVYNFLIPVISIFMFIVYRNFKLKTVNRNIYLIIFIVLIVLSSYLGLGIIYYNSIQSLIYFRLLTLPFFFYVLGYLISKENESKIKNKLDKIILISVVVLSVSAILGRVSPLFMDLVNDEYYFSLKYHNNMTISEIREGFTTKFLNWNVIKYHSFRYGSLLKNTISYSYVMYISATYLYFNRKINILEYLVVFFIVFFVSFSKGAILFAILSIFIFWLQNKYSKGKVDFTLMLVVLLPFWSLIILTGYLSHNEHIIGFFAGFERLIENPIGNGIGFSGNLSDMRLTSINGNALPNRGYWTRFYNGSESMVGVIFSSLGVMAILYFISLFYIITHSKKYINHAILIIPFLMVFQGIFQEEAFSPYALGYGMLILGIYCGYGKKRLQEKA